MGLRRRLRVAVGFTSVCSKAELTVRAEWRPRVSTTALTPLGPLGGRGVFTATASNRAGDKVRRMTTGRSGGASDINQ